MQPIGTLAERRAAAERARHARKHSGFTTPLGIGDALVGVLKIACAFGAVAALWLLVVLWFSMTPTPPTP
jgi:hypothetical protein